MKLPFDSQLLHPFLQCMSSKMGALITLNYLWSAIGSKEMLQASFGLLLVCATGRKSNQKSCRRSKASPTDGLQPTLSFALHATNADVTIGYIRGRLSF